MQSTHPTLKKVSLALGIFVLTMLIQAVYSVSISPLYDFEGVDSAIYEYMGLNWYMGGMPYYDLFEGKGPLIFLINAAGWAISDRGWGIYLLQCINYTLVVLLWIKIAELFADKKKALLAVLTTGAIYLLMNEEGNLTEDWCMLPISYSMYLLARMVRDERVPKLWEFLLAGIGAGLVTMTRMNNMPITVLLGLYTAYYLVRQKQIGRLMAITVVALAGWLIPVAAFAAYFYARMGWAGVDWLYYGTIGFNLDYARNHDASLVPMLVKAGYWAAVALLLWLMRKQGMKQKRYMLLAALLFVLSYAVFGKSLYMHYFMIVLPILVMVFALAYEAGEKSTWVLLAVLLIADVGVGANDMWQYLTSNGHYYARNYNEESDRLLSMIPKQDRDSVFNYYDEFLQTAALKRNRIMQCNRAMGRMPLEVSQRMYDETHLQLEQQQPKWIVFSRTWFTPEDSLYVNQHYEQVGQTQYDLDREYLFCYDQVKLYKRK